MSAVGCCRSLGCLDPQCVLCEHNPNRRCNVNFAPKYLVNDILKAKCEAPIRVEIIDRATGVPLGEDIPDVQLEASAACDFALSTMHAAHTYWSASVTSCMQMCILDGNAYDAKCLEAGQEREEDLDGCSLLLNNKVCSCVAALHPCFAQPAARNCQEVHANIITTTCKSPDH